jgi:hypothetical protein
LSQEKELSKFLKLKIMYQKLVWLVSLSTLLLIEKTKSPTMLEWKSPPNSALEKCGQESKGSSNICLLFPHSALNLNKKSVGTF